MISSVDALDLDIHLQSVTPLAVVPATLKVHVHRGDLRPAGCPVKNRELTRPSFGPDHGDTG